MKIRVTAKPRAKREYIKQLAEGEFVVAVKAPPTDGKANQAIAKILAKKFGVAPSWVSLVSGTRGKMKIFEIEN